MECMFTAQGPSVLHAIEVAVVQLAQVHLVQYKTAYLEESFEGTSLALQV